MASTIPNMIWTHWKFVPRRQPNLKIDEKRWIVDVVIHFFSLTQNYACRHRQTKQLSWLGWLAGERYSSWEIKLSFDAAISFRRNQNTKKISWLNFQFATPVWLLKWFFKQVPRWNIFVFWDQVKHLWRSIIKKGSVSNRLKLVSDLDLDLIAL